MVERARSLLDFSKGQSQMPIQRKSAPSSHHAGAPLFEPLEDRRLMSAGGMDLSFSFDGQVSTAFGASGAYGLAVATQADGKILAGGVASGSLGEGYFAVARINRD